MTRPSSLIINSPFVCPAQHWVEGAGGKLEIPGERRPASYEVLDPRQNTKRTETLDLVVQHVLAGVTEQNSERLTPVFDEENPIGSTGQMRTWYTTKPTIATTKSHISYVVGDSAWEGHAANVLETRDEVLPLIRPAAPCA